MFVSITQGIEMPSAQMFKAFTMPRYQEPVYELFMPPVIRDSDGLWTNGLCTFLLLSWTMKESQPWDQRGDVGGLTIDYITQRSLITFHSLSTFHWLFIGRNKVIKPGDAFCPFKTAVNLKLVLSRLVFAPVKSIHHIEIPSLQMTPHQDKGRHDDS